ncbi:MAG: hypothetical protein A2017_16180 [Lentisphaerae bacterium GWF2_44_16]|nr:MAG: hypothetical protein A2017_16180 [Lentisphaerae bacterium GWF2_44_16]
MVNTLRGDREDKSVNIAKNELGLKRSATFPSGDLETNLRASIRFLARKGFGTSGQAVGKNPDKTFDGKPNSIGYAYHEDDEA